MLTTKDIENFRETFNDETPLGEPQYWIYLKSGRSLEITHEEYGLSEDKQFFSIRLHSTDEEFYNEEYSNTVGVITTLVASTAQETLNCINAIMRTFKEMED